MSSAQRTLFLDRDGVINERLPGDYVRHPDQFRFLPEVLPALATLADLFPRIVIVTNQQGIGKGLMTASELQRVHAHMLDAVRESGGRIDGVYFCPDLATRSGNCRKPAPSLALRAQRDFPEIRFSDSVMVGDSASDIAFGAGLGMQTIFITTKAGEERILLAERLEPDSVYGSLAAYTQALISA